MKRCGLFKMFAVVVLLVMLLGTPQTAMANTRTETGADVPFYARIGFRDGDLFAIVFYRPPECVPADFNLLKFFQDPVIAGQCGPATTDGFQIWENGPATDFGPIMTELKGNGAVPIWIVSYSEILAAAEDGVLTIEELASLPSLQIGYASFYQETLRPSPTAVTVTILMEAHGAMENGNDFTFHLNISPAGRHVKIEIAD